PALEIRNARRNAHREDGTGGSAPQSNPDGALEARRRAPHLPRIGGLARRVAAENLLPPESPGTRGRDRKGGGGAGAREPRGALPRDRPVVWAPSGAKRA